MAEAFLPPRKPAVIEGTGYVDWRGKLGFSEEAFLLPAGYTVRGQQLSLDGQVREVVCSEAPALRCMSSTNSLTTTTGDSLPCTTLLDHHRIQPKLPNYFKGEENEEKLVRESRHRTPICLLIYHCQDNLLRPRSISSNHSPNYLLKLATLMEKLSLHSNLATFDEIVPPLLTVDSEEFELLTTSTSGNQQQPPPPPPIGHSLFKKLTDVTFRAPKYDTDLRTVVRSRQALSMDHVGYFAYQLLSGLKYLHSAGLSHGNLRSGKISVDADCRLYIGGLEESLVFCNPALLTPGSGNNEAQLDVRSIGPETAPEVLIGMTPPSSFVCDLKVADIWSTGCIIAGMVTRTSDIFFAKVNDRVQLARKIFDSLPLEEDLIEFFKEGGCSRAVERFLEEYSPRRKEGQGVGNASTSATAGVSTNLSPLLQLLEATKPKVPPFVEPFVLSLNPDDRRKDNGSGGETCSEKDQRNLLDLLEKMLQIDPRNRSTAGDLLSHSFFEQFSEMGWEEISYPLLKTKEKLAAAIRRDLIPVDLCDERLAPFLGFTEILEEEGEIIAEMRRIGNLDEATAARELWMTVNPTIVASSTIATCCCEELPKS